MLGPWLGYGRVLVRLRVRLGSGLNQDICLCRHRHVNMDICQGRHIDKNPDLCLVRHRYINSD